MFPSRSFSQKIGNQCPKDVVLELFLPILRNSLSSSPLQPPQNDTRVSPSGFGTTIPNLQFHRRIKQHPVSQHSTYSTICAEDKPATASTKPPIFRQFFVSHTIKTPALPKPIRWHAGNQNKLNEIRHPTKVAPFCDTSSRENSR